MRTALHRCAVAYMMFAFATGCGKDEGLPIVHVSGTVTFNSKPVPNGMIIFEPNPAKGGRGPQGHAEIRDGSFDTRKNGKGVPSGSVVLHVTGGDGVNPEPFTPLGKFLFDEYVTVVEIAPDGAVITIDVPVKMKR